MGPRVQSLADRHVCGVARGLVGGEEVRHMVGGAGKKAQICGKRGTVIGIGRAGLRRENDHLVQWGVGWAGTRQSFARAACSRLAS